MDDLSMPGEIFDILAEEIRKEIDAEIRKKIEPIVVRMWLK